MKEASSSCIANNMLKVHACWMEANVMCLKRHWSCDAWLMLVWGREKQQKPCVDTNKEGSKVSLEFWMQLCENNNDDNVLSELNMRSVISAIIVSFMCIWALGRYENNEIDLFGKFTFIMQNQCQLAEIKCLDSLKQLHPKTIAWEPARTLGWRV